MDATLIFFSEHQMIVAHIFYRRFTFSQAAKCYRAKYSYTELIKFG